MEATCENKFFPRGRVNLNNWGIGGRGGGGVECKLERVLGMFMTSLSPK